MIAGVTGDIGAAEGFTVAGIAVGVRVGVGVNVGVGLGVGVAVGVGVGVTVTDGLTAVALKGILTPNFDGFPGSQTEKDVGTHSSPSFSPGVCGETMSIQARRHSFSHSLIA